MKAKLLKLVCRLVSRDDQRASLISNSRKRKTIFMIWLNYSLWSLIWEWYAVLVSKKISSFSKIVCQKFDRNFESRSNMIVNNISQFTCCNLSIRAWAHFFVDHVNLSEISISLLKNLLIMISKHFNSFILIDNVRIKFSVIVWKKIFAKFIKIISL